MIDYPYLKEQPTSRKTVEVFKGYNRNLRIGAGEFCGMENMTADHNPVLSPRGKRGRIEPLADPKGMFRVPSGALYFTDGDKLLMHSSGMTHTVATGLIETNIHRQFALMGKALIIVPDMKWLDIGNPFSGLHGMGETWKVEAGKVTVSLCKGEELYYEVYQNVTTSPEPPSNPGNQTLWIDNSQSPSCLKQYRALTEEWMDVPTTYLKISGLGDHRFEEGDGITLSGLGDGSNIQVSALNGSHVIRHMGHGEIVITGILDETWEQDCGEYPVTLERMPPQLDFVVEAGNRLWGCIQGVNEIYACKLGDFKNWNVFSGLSTDSWVGNVGASGKFTGAINQGGYPVFYTENSKHKVWPSATGAHQITSTPCLGVEQESYGSLALYNGQLLYLSPEGVCMDDGSGPVTVDQSLAGLACSDGVGAVHQHKYYLCATDRLGKWHLLVYDLRTGLWHREDGAAFLDMVSHEGRLYGAGRGHLWDLTGHEGTPEEKVSWRVRTGDLMLEIPDRKYITRLTLRMSLEPGSKVEIFARYDHEEGLTKLGTAYGRKLGSFSLPVRPRRCDHLQLELQGEGMAKIYSITKTLEKGSELP